MDLIEPVGYPDALLPTAEFRAHLRLGTGFADDASQDGELNAYLRAAIAAIEARTGKALFIRGFRLRLSAWRWSDAQALPIAPVEAIGALSITDAAGQNTIVDPSAYRMVVDRHRPRLVAAGAILPQIPEGGRVTVDFDAGLAVDWDGLPGDLRQAVLLLAARLYDQRTGALPEIPMGIGALLAAWRPVRLSLGSVAQ